MGYGACEIPETICKSDEMIIKEKVESPMISGAIRRRWFPSKIARFRAGKNPLRYYTEELLLLCARQNLTKHLIDKAKQFPKKDIDWDFFTDFAMRSGLSYIYWNTLKNGDYPQIGAIPTFVIDKLRLGYLYVMPKVECQHKETKELLELLSKKNIPAIPLKGPFLSKRLYGDIAARGISTDIDLLVEKKNKNKTKTILEEAGYTFTPPNKKQPELSWQYVFAKRGSTTVDLHWTINPAISNEVMKYFWKGTTLGEEELLLYLSVHFVGDAQITQLRYIVDINEALIKYGNTLNWENLIEKAKKYKISRSLYTALNLCRELFGSSVPQEALDKLKPGLAKRAFINTFANRELIMGRAPRRKRLIERFMRYFFFPLIEACSFKDYLAIIFPPKEKMGSKTYLRRLTEGMSRFAQAWKR